MPVNQGIHERRLHRRSHAAPINSITLSDRGEGERSPSRRIDLYVSHDGRLASPDGAQTVVMRFGLRR
jgi:hypothetical protein